MPMLSVTSLPANSAGMLSVRLNHTTPSKSSMPFSSHTPARGRVFQVLVSVFRLAQVPGADIPASRAITRSFHAFIRAL